MDLLPGTARPRGTRQAGEWLRDWLAVTANVAGIVGTIVAVYLLMAGR